MLGRRSSLEHVMGSVLRVSIKVLWCPGSGPDDGAAFDFYRLWNAPEL